MPSCSGCTAGGARCRLQLGCCHKRPGRRSLAGWRQPLRRRRAGTVAWRDVQHCRPGHSPEPHRPGPGGDAAGSSGGLDGASRPRSECEQVPRGAAGGVAAAGRAAAAGSGPAGRQPAGRWVGPAAGSMWGRGMQEGGAAPAPVLQPASSGRPSPLVAGGWIRRKRSACGSGAMAQCCKAVLARASASLLPALRAPPAGSLPPGLLSLAATNLSLGGNAFTGQLPANWSSPTLLELDMGNNNLTGTLPPAWGASLPALAALRLEGNSLEGGAGRGGAPLLPWRPALDALLLRAAGEAVGESSGQQGVP